jgi:hypothetical protein
MPAKSIINRGNRGRDVVRLNTAQNGPMHRLVRDNLALRKKATDLMLAIYALRENAVAVPGTGQGPRHHG